MYSKKQIENLNADTSALLQIKRSSFLSPDLAKDFVERLSAAINYHDYRYYVLAEPIIKDIDYDYLFDALIAIEQKHPNLQAPDSPTQRVARGLSDGFETVEHLTPMLSLAKAYSEDDLHDYEKSLKKLVEEEELEYIAEPKFDGSSITLIYENDLLIRGATRGNGIAGDNITNNIKTVASIPLSAKFSDFGIYKAELRGEVVIRKDRFEAMNKALETAGKRTYSNARNTAAGALRQKDSSQISGKNLEAFVYQIGLAQDKDGNDMLPQLQKHYENLSLLFKLGFKTDLKNANDRSFIFKGIDAVIKYCNQWRDRRKAYPYEIDGIVIKLNDLHLQSVAGATSHHPRWAVAFKFDAKQATTKLLRVEFQVGRTGAITPVAKLETVNLAGANISNASLHNEDFITEKDIRVGDTVLLERAGDVIPYIVEPIKEERDGSEIPIEFPKHCPSCASKLLKPEGESVWRCFNADCPVQVEGHIIHFVSKSSMDIRGLGKDIVRRFLKEGLMNGVEDVYRLDYEKIRVMDGWGDKSAENLQNSVEASKQQALYRLIVGLGIREVGETTAKLLAGTVQSLLDLKDWTVEQLMELPDIGPRVAENILDFFKTEKNLQLIATLRDLGVNIERSEGDLPQLDSRVFEGMSFLFTGALQQLKRNEAKQLVESNGGKTVSAVSGKLNYLVVGDNPGSKLTKARKIDTIKIITEADFLGMLEA